jgi:hypothetical protein
MQAERQRQSADAAARDKNGHDTPLIDGVMAWEATGGNCETSPQSSCRDLLLK